MEPQREEQVKREDSPPEPKRKRFRLEKLEERIAPKAGAGNGGGTGGTNHCETKLWCDGYSTVCSME